MPDESMEDMSEEGMADAGQRKKNKKGRKVAKKHNADVVQLVHLVHKLGTSEESKKDINLRQLYKHIATAFPEEVLKIMHRVLSWDRDPSEHGVYLYARAAFEKGQPNLAKKILQPLLKDGASDTTLLLGARILSRLKDHVEARELLDRIPAGSKLSKNVEQTRARMAGNMERAEAGTTHKGKKSEKST